MWVTTSPHHRGRVHEAGRLDEARDVLDVIPDDDDEKPQLLGALAGGRT